MKKPVFVQTFLLNIPAWMQQHIFIVEGDMCREDIEVFDRPVSSRESRTEVGRKVTATGLLYSPAVTLGTFVLTGWLERTCRLGTCSSASPETRNFPLVENFSSVTIHGLSKNGLGQRGKSWVAFFGKVSELSSTSME